jgi:phosphoglycolate phosphatase
LKNVFLFDFDYTLGESTKGIIQCITYAFLKLGKPVPNEYDIKRSVGMSLEKTYSFLSKSNNKEESNIFQNLFMEKADEIMVDNTYLYENVKETIIDFFMKNIYLGIISTKYRYRLESILAREQILHCFKIIIGGEDVTHHKPNKESILMAAKKGNFSLDRVIYIGDSLIDAETAKNAKVDFIASLTGVTIKEEFMNFGTKTFINHIAELSCYFI